ncbi:MAG TPA: ParB/RepB/Spo0J family partition protein [Candidatus Saccharimonadales bacterium]|nr:ParB/RepB/Spo0J family partition protein [Candidatus Saccharimonadales bacterium]
MASNKLKGLGRGFDSLIPTNLVDEAFDPTNQQDKELSQAKELAVADIFPNVDQPRKQFNEEALDELANSIKEHGVLLPLIVTPEGHKYMIIAGERRWRAAQKAGISSVPVVIRTMTDQHKLEIALIENLQREDLNPLEMATAYLKLHEQFNLTYEQIGQRVGRSMSSVSNILRLLGLPEEAKQAVAEGKISEGHGRQILAIKELEVQKELLRLILTHGWSVRKAEQFVVGYKEGQKNKKSAVAKTQVETDGTKALGKRLGAEVRVKNMAKGGLLQITFKNQDDLDRITKLLITS